MVALVLGALLISACGPGDIGTAEVRAAAPSPSPAPASPTTTGPPRPRKVLVAGDSMAGNLAPALKAALASGTVTDVRFKLTPTLEGDPPLRLSWERELPVFDPDVVVMFLGIWESKAAGEHGYPFADPARRPAYEADVLDPWVRFITSYGARVLWVTHAPVGPAEIAWRLEAFDAVVGALPPRWPHVTLVPSRIALNGVDEPAFHGSVPGPDGVPRRTRQIDGFHLCPEGAARLAATLVDHLGGPVPEAGDWTSGPWRADPAAFPPGTCP